MKKCDVCNKLSDDITRTNKLGYETNLCRRHYDQVLKHGAIKLIHRNVFTVKENYIELEINTKEEKYLAKISKEDYDLVSKYEWWTYQSDYTRYVVAYINGNQTNLHKYIVGEVDENMSIDHVDRDGLNNTRANLRVVSNTVQNVNQKIRKDNTSGVKGVSFHKPSNKWRVRINYGNVSKCELIEDFDVAVQLRKLWEEERDGVLGL